MLAALDDLSTVEDHDLIEFADGVDSTRDDDDGSSGENPPELRLDAALGLRVDRGERVVEDEDAGIEGERAGECGALALPPGEHHAALADEGVVALRQVCDVARQLCSLRGAPDVLAGRVGRQAVGDVRVDRQRKEEGVLRNHGDRLPQPWQRDLIHVDPVDEDLRVPDLVNPRDHRGEGRLPGADGSDDTQGRSGRDHQRHVVEGILATVRSVRERQATELDPAVQLAGVDGFTVIRDRRLDGQDLIDPLHR